MTAKQWKAVCFEELWMETDGDPRGGVAILDGAVDQANPSLRNAKLSHFATELPSPGATSRHGTYVTSLIFGQHDGPVLGVAPLCRGLIIPIFRDDGSQAIPSCSQKELGHAIRTAVTGSGLSASERALTIACACCGTRRWRSGVPRRRTARSCRRPRRSSAPRWRCWEQATRWTSSCSACAASH